MHALTDKIETANALAVERITASEPVLVDIQRAGDALEGLGERTLLHSGPPIEWGRMCAPTREAVAGAIVFEGWADDLEAARALAASGDVDFRPNHEFGAVGPMTGITTPGMPLLVVENTHHGNRAYCTINEGMGNVMRFGGNDAEVVERLRWIRDDAAPALRRALQTGGGIALKPLIARGLSMGDEMHMRNVACSSLLFRALAARLASTADDGARLAHLLQFIASNDMFFLNIGMAMAKSMIDAAHGIEGSSVVTTMCRNGTDFGIRVSGTGNEWFTAPATLPKGLYFAGFSEKDANLDMGDSCIVETVGLGGFSMAASPAVVGFVGAGSVAAAEDYSRSMYEITAGRNPAWTIPALGSMGVPTGIDIRKVLHLGLTPVINTAITHRLPGRGQVGAGIAQAPLDCFRKALISFSKHVGVA